MLTDRHKIIIKAWIFGVFIALAVCWIIGANFLSDIFVWEKCPELDLFVKAPGVHMHTSEGWSKTHFGKYGFMAIPDVKSIPGPILEVWGSSHVEGFQVDDQYKLQSQINACLKHNPHLANITAVAIAHSDWKVGSYLDAIPTYEKFLCPSCHIIVLTNWNNFQNCRNYKNLNPRETHKKKNLIRLRKILYKLKLGFAFNIAVKWVRKSLPHIRFGPGTASSPNQDNLNPILAPPLQEWAFALEQFKQVTKLPVIFLYSPAIPTLEHGRIVTQDPYHDWALQFELLCYKFHFGFINVTDNNNKYFQEYGKFPRGFHNGKLAKGHSNKAAYSIMAHALCAYLEKHQHDIYSN